MGVNRRFALQTEPVRPALDQMQRAQARRIAAVPIPAKRARIERVILSKPVSRSGARTFRALAFSEAPANILLLKRRQPEIRTYISGAPPNTALLRLSGQHGAARGAIR